MGIFKKKKLAPAFKGMKRTIDINSLPEWGQQILAEEGIFQDFISEEHELLEDMEDAIVNLRHATWNFSRALDRLNAVNAQLNRGPVDIEDELLHHCYSQETLNKRYADINARHHAKLEQRLQKLQNPAAESDRQK